MEQSLYSRETLARSVSVSDVVPAVRKAFVAKHQNRVQMPAKSYLYFGNHNGDLRTMPAHVPEFNLATVKIVNAHPENPVDYNLPTVMALIVAVDPETGFPKAILDGTEITALRTAAASALSTRVLAPAKSRSLGLLGTGEQARYQVRGQMAERDFETIHLHDIDDENAQSLADWINESYPQVETRVQSRPEIVYRESHVLVSLTPVTTPILDDLPDETAPMLINAMGADAPEKQEWPRRLFETTDVVVDDWDQASHSGEISHLVEAGEMTHSDVLATLGEYLADPPNTRPERVLFDSTGLAIQDTAAAHVVLSAGVEADDAFDFLNLNST